MKVTSGSGDLLPNSQEKYLLRVGGFTSRSGAFFGLVVADVASVRGAPKMAGNETAKPAQVCKLQETLCA
jgi:hypothetical protein